VSQQFTLEAQDFIVQTTNSISGITGEVMTDEWYTKQDTVELMYKLLEPVSGSTVMCPFDTDKSQFVQVGEKLGFEVFRNIRNWLESEYEYDYLITNPPFSIKDKVIEKVLQSGKPSALVLPLDALGGKRRHELYKEYGYPTVYVPTRRINYISEDGQDTKSNHFHSVILIFNDPLNRGLIWE
jgi:hypothetical protein